MIMMLFLLSTLVLLGVDQLTKWLADTHLNGQPPVMLWPGVFHLDYVQNQGAAFGLMQGLQWLFIPFALIIAFLSFRFCRSLPKTPRTWPIRFCCAMLCAGALGNMIDRIRLGYVIDFLYFRLIDFPVFNVADIYVCVSLGLSLIFLLTINKDMLQD